MEEEIHIKLEPKDDVLTETLPDLEYEDNIKEVKVEMESEEEEESDNALDGSHIVVKSEVVCTEADVEITHQSASSIPYVGGRHTHNKAYSLRSSSRHIAPRISKIVPDEMSTSFKSDDASDEEMEKSTSRKKISYKCPHCKLVVRSQISLKKHIKSNHNVAGSSEKMVQVGEEQSVVGDVTKFPQKCSFCDFETVYRSVLEQHSFVKHLNRTTSFRCNYCSYSTNYKHSLKQHNLSQHSLTYNGRPATLLNCSECSFTTHHRGRLKSHMLRSHNIGTRFMCPYCEYMTGKRQDLKRHMNKKHGVKTDTGHICPHCNFETGSISVYKAHMSIKHPDKREVRKCAKCCFYTVSSVELRVHRRKEHGHRRNIAEVNFKCYFCDHGAASKDNLEKHIFSEHDGGLVSSTIFKPFVETASRLRGNFQDSMGCVSAKDGSHHGRINLELLEASDEIIEEDEGGVNRHHNASRTHNRGFPLRSISRRIAPGVTKAVSEEVSCSFVSEDVASNDDIKMDKSVIRKNISYKCPHCKLVARSQITLEKHIKSNHNVASSSEKLDKDGEEQAVDGDVTELLQKCSYCDFETIYISVLKQHSFVKHLDLNKPFRCNSCFYSTKYKRDLNLHNLKHSGNPSKLLYCTKCRFTTPQRETLKSHLLRVHNIGKRFKCPNCEHVTGNRRDLKRHMNKKHGIKTDTGHMCPYCNFDTGSISVYKAHLSVKHPDKPEIRLKCDKCRFYAVSAFQLEVHRCKKHGEGENFAEDKFECNFCDHGAASKDKLKKHLFGEHDRALVGSNIFHSAIETESRLGGNFQDSVGCLSARDGSDQGRINLESLDAKEKIIEEDEVKVKIEPGNTTDRSIVDEVKLSGDDFGGEVDLIKLEPNVELVVSENEWPTTEGRNAVNQDEDYESTLPPPLTSYPSCEVISELLHQFHPTSVDSNEHKQIDQQYDHSEEISQSSDFSARNGNEGVTVGYKLAEFDTKLHYKCELCPYFTENESYITTHVLWHNTGESEHLACHKCEFSTRYKSELTYHLSALHNIGKSFKCSECEYVTPRKGNFNSHMWRKHGKTAEMKYKCRYCKFQSDVEQIFRGHLKAKHGGFKRQIEKKFKCEKCNFVGSTKSEAEKHCEKPLIRFKCLDCNYQANNKVMLEKHVLHDHYMPRDPIANYLLKAHVWKKPFRSGDAPHRCLHCSYSAFHVDDVKAHLLSSHSIKEGSTFRCLRCHFTASYQEDLKVHMWMKHRKRGDPTHKCLLCCYGSFELDQVKNHILKNHCVKKGMHIL